MKLNKHNIIKYLRIIGVFILLLPFFYSFKNQNGNTEPSPIKVIIAMLDTIKKTKSYEFSLKAMERVEKGEYLSAESYVKLNMNPKALYFRNEKRKISVMYVAGTNENKALVKAKSLMNTTVSLDPYGNMMRKNQHYTIHQLGYDYFGKTIATALTKDRENLSKNLKFLPKKTINGKTCIGLIFNDPKFTYIKYTVGKNEDVSSISAKFNVSEYLLRLKNDLHSFYGDIKEGKIIDVPTNYYKNILLYLDEKTLLPAIITIYDDIGLFENYEFMNVKTNKKFGAEDFGKFYKD